jgi:hypothetical protein
LSFFFLFIHSKIISLRTEGKSRIRGGIFRHGGPEITFLTKQKNPETKTINKEFRLQIPGCTVHLMNEGEALELAKGKFTIARILDEGVSLLTW